MSMTHQPGDHHPVPLIDSRRCTGCGLCVLVCCHHALALQDGAAVVINPLACAYEGYCEGVCPAHAIHRPFEIIRL